MAGKRIFPFGFGHGKTRQNGRLANFITRYTPNAFWGIDKKVMKKMKKNAIVMHPLPHLDEIAPELDPARCTNRRIAYFRQSENKLYVAMAFLYYLIKVRKPL